MNSAETNPSLLILRGPPGGGKTTIGNLIPFSWSQFRFVEVDRFKKDPKSGILQDRVLFFSEAGRHARYNLDEGYNVVTAEYFVGASDIDLFLEPVLAAHPNLIIEFAWLDCALDEALKRKPEIKKMQMYLQHLRKRYRTEIPGEYVCDTTDKCSTTIMKHLFKHCYRHLATSNGFSVLPLPEGRLKRTRRP